MVERKPTFMWAARESESPWALPRSLWDVLFVGK